jgi:hypothetical protein
MSAHRNKHRPARERDDTIELNREGGGPFYPPGGPPLSRIPRLKVIVAGVRRRPVARDQHPLELLTDLHARASLPLEPSSWRHEQQDRPNPCGLGCWRSNSCIAHCRAGSTSLGSSRPIAFTSSGRSVLAPDIFSLNTLAQPAALSSASWAAKF